MFDSPLHTSVLKLPPGGGPSLRVVKLEEIEFVFGFIETVAHMREYIVMFFKLTEIEIFLENT